ncbi:MAG: IPT/TIG domain-containing protein [Bacteroidota bacterium]
MKLNSIVLSFAAIACCITCSTDDHTFHSREYASVETGDVTDINENGATLHGEFLGMGTLDLKDYGFLYDQANANTKIGSSERISLGTTAQTNFSGTADRALEDGQTCWYRTYAIVGSNNLIVYGAERSFVAKGSLPPSITEIVPSSGKQGDLIVINGLRFSDKSYTSIVTIGGVRAFVTKTSSTSITCTVPFLPAGDRDVLVKIGENGTPSAPKTFTITN